MESSKAGRVIIVKNTHPQKTPFEQSMGVYVEELEPQVREAVIRMRELSYSTTISGFWDKDYHQIIQGDFTFNNATKTTLRGMGVSVREYMSFGYPCTDIEFQSEIPDLEVIRRKWNAIVAVLPPSGQPLLNRPRWKMVVDETFPPKKEPR